MLKSLEWKSLERRRADAKLMMLYRINHKLVDVTTKSLAAAPTRTRGSACRFYQTFTRVDAYTFSFFPSAIRLWNKSTQELVSQPSVDRFRQDAFNADVHGLIGRIYFEVNQLRKALTHCIKSKDLAIKSDVKACQLRALENLGRIYICQHDYKSAVQQWILKLDIIDDAEERAWLCHDIGRCYMEMEQFTEVLEYGEKALMESQDVTNKHALLSSKVLIAQAHAKLVDYVAAKEMYEKALSLAQYLGKKSTENLIQEALEKVSECAEAAEGALEYMSSHHGIDTCGQSTGLPTGKVSGACSPTLDSQDRKNLERREFIRNDVSSFDKTRLLTKHAQTHRQTRRGGVHMNVRYQHNTRANGRSWTDKKSVPE
ncbi:hypothetical protein LSAT2_007647 [Lamellibrachia satsuma]|nr:hypothetical protein LSAT2_007647 [Lamellibrachia satsuma]